ncbi:hypothetical protein HPP92_013050 [Vanilla planifolia]|uniref:Uncharacterized protein n=1 Tax=Vanilla planifolia TaxID=51239 RepID=A0A835QP94_VANPL|nr:hypothetical protein HPP92_013050 [Vanilla planifolia]
MELAQKEVEVKKSLTKQILSHQDVLQKVHATHEELKKSEVLEMELAQKEVEVKMSLTKQMLSHQDVLLKVHTTHEELKKVKGKRIRKLIKVEKIEELQE